MARSRKTLDEQKGNLTTETQENFKEAEEQIGQLTKISNDIPDFLVNDEVAKEQYMELLPLVKELPVTQLDRTQLAIYCQFYSVFVEASKLLQKEDLITTSERGSKLNLALTALRQSQEQMIKIAPKLGMTIDSRLKIFTPKKEEKKDPFEEMFQDD